MQRFLAQYPHFVRLLCQKRVLNVGRAYAHRAQGQEHSQNRG
jgi:hypothetical protein